MYDELIKSLRNMSQMGTKYGMAVVKMREAADAIEELSEYVNTIKKLKCEGWQLQQVKFHDGYQAMTIMPIPEPPKEET